MDPQMYFKVELGIKALATGDALEILLS